MKLLILRPENLLGVKMINNVMFLFQKLWVLDRKFLKTAIAVCARLSVQQGHDAHLLFLSKQIAVLVTSIWKFDDVNKIMTWVKYNVSDNLYWKCHRDNSFKTLHKTCENTHYAGQAVEMRFFPYTGEYGSVKTYILAYFM